MRTDRPMRAGVLVRVGLIAATVAVIDISTKNIARSKLSSGEAIDVLGSFAQFRLGFNPGVAFGAWSEQPIVALVLPATITLILAGYIWHLSARPAVPAGSFVGLALILGGAIGNLVDRFGDRLVTDFISIGTSAYRFPTFNGADIAITLGVAWLLVSMNRNESAVSERPDDKVVS